MPTTNVEIACVSEVAISEQKTFDGQPFPLVLGPDAKHADRDLTGWCRWIADNLSALRVTLLKHGALLFRGFPISDPTAFDQFAKTFGYEPFPYEGGAAPRAHVVGHVFTANEAPPDKIIPFHTEMGQAVEFPKIVFFYCDEAPPEGGETPIVYTPAVYPLVAERAPDFAKRLREEGVRYVRILPDGDDCLSPIGRGWQSTFSSSTRDEAEREATARRIDCKWLADGSMHTTSPNLPPIRQDERTGKTVWHNSLCNHYAYSQQKPAMMSVAFSGGEALPDDQIKIVVDTMNEVAVAFRWHRGDVLLLDNRQTQHGRKVFTPPRRVLASLYKD